MNLLSRKSAQTDVVVLEIGAEHASLARYAVSGRTLGRCESLASEPLSSPPEAEGLPPTDLPEVLRKLRTRFSGGRLDHVQLVLPGHLALLKSIALPATARAQREKLIRFEAAQNIPYPLAEVTWSHQVSAESEQGVQVMLAAAKTDQLEAWLQQIESAGFAIGAVLPSGIALAESRTQLVPPDEVAEADHGSCLLVSIGARSSHLLFGHDGGFALRTLSLAGQTLTRSIADRLEQTPAEAENLKLKVLTGEIDLPADSPAARAVKGAADAFVARLQLEISRSLVTQRRTENGGEPKWVALTGQGAALPGLAERLQEKLKLPAQAVVWPGTLFAGPEKPAPSAESIGAAIVAASGETDERINLFPAELMAQRAAQKQRPRWLIAASLLVLATALPGVHWMRLASVREAATTELSRRMAPHQSWRDQNMARLESLQRLRGELAVLTELQAARESWPTLLADIQGRLQTVDSSWLERIQVLPPDPSTLSRSSNRSSDPTIDDGSAPPPREPVRLRLSGRLLDRQNPLSRVSQSAYEQATALLGGFVESPHVIATEGERFDASEPGILRFDFTLVINPQLPL